MSIARVVRRRPSGWQRLQGGEEPMAVLTYVWCFKYLWSEAEEANYQERWQDHFLLPWQYQLFMGSLSSLSCLMLWQSSSLALSLPTPKPAFMGRPMEVEYYTLPRNWESFEGGDSCFCGSTASRNWWTSGRSPLLSRSTLLRYYLGGGGSGSPKCRIQLVKPFYLTSTTTQFYFIYNQVFKKLQYHL